MCSCSVSIAWFAAASSRRQIRTITPSVSTRTLFRILPSLIPRLAGACLRSHSHSCLRRPPYTQASLAIRPFTDRLGQFSTVVLYGVFETLHGFFFAFTFWMPFGIVAQSILKNITCFVQNRFVWCGVPKQFTSNKKVPDVFALHNCSDLLRVFHLIFFSGAKLATSRFTNIFAIRWVKYTMKGVLEDIADLFEVIRNATGRVSLGLFPGLPRG